MTSCFQFFTIFYGGVLPAFSLCRNFQLPVGVCSQEPSREAGFDVAGFYLFVCSEDVGEIGSRVSRTYFLDPVSLISTNYLQSPIIMLGI